MAKFKPGQSGNPKGKPRGTKDKRTALRQLLEPHAEGLVQKAVDMALEGDSSALRLCLERIIPAYRAQDAPTGIDLSKMDLSCPEGILKAGNAVVGAVTEGRVTPDHGKALVTLLDSQRKALDTVELEQRLADLELYIERKQT
jgi:hypothetical protein